MGNYMIYTYINISYELRIYVLLTLFELIQEYYMSLGFPKYLNMFN